MRRHWVMLACAALVFCSTTFAQEVVTYESAVVALTDDAMLRAEFERHQDLIVANVDAARPAIRRRLGLPPLQ